MHRIWSASPPWTSRPVHKTVPVDRHIFFHSVPSPPLFAGRPRSRRIRQARHRRLAAGDAVGAEDAISSPAARHLCRRRLATGDASLSDVAQAHPCHLLSATPAIVGRCRLPPAAGRRHQPVAYHRSPPPNAAAAPPWAPPRGPLLPPWPPPKLPATISSPAITHTRAPPPLPWPQPPSPPPSATMPPVFTTTTKPLEPLPSSSPSPAESRHHPRSGPPPRSTISTPSSSPSAITQGPMAVSLLSPLPSSARRPPPPSSSPFPALPHLLFPVTHVQIVTTCTSSSLLLRPNQSEPPATSSFPSSPLPSSRLVLSSSPPSHRWTEKPINAVGLLLPNISVPSVRHGCPPFPPLCFIIAAQAAQATMNPALPISFPPSRHHSSTTFLPPFSTAPVHGRHLDARCLPSPLCPLCSKSEPP